VLTKIKNFGHPSREGTAIKGGGSTTNRSRNKVAVTQNPSDNSILSRDNNYPKIFGVHPPTARGGSNKVHQRKEGPFP